MKTTILILASIFWVTIDAHSQQTIKLDTNSLNINAKEYLFEKYRGKQAIYLKGGSITIKDVVFLNGTVTFDIYLKEEQAFPGVTFRYQPDTEDGEKFYLRPHQAGNPDATQAIPMTKGLTPWQLYHGTKYSFPFEFRFGEWTHVEIRVKDNLAQVFLDNAEQPNLTWNLFHDTQAGAVYFNGGNRSGMHLANITIDPKTPELINPSPVVKEPIEGLIPSWEISDMFDESSLSDVSKLEKLISDRKWQGSVNIEEGTAANISRIQQLYDGSDNNTVFAKINIQANKEQLKLFQFGYSDRAVVIINGQPLYQGQRNFRSRDYRYLGTIGLFDGVYLPLKKGKNELLIAVSEDFGGWLITGKFVDYKEIKIQ